MSRRAIFGAAAAVAAGGTGVGLFQLRSHAQDDDELTWSQPGETSGATPTVSKTAAPSNKPMGGGPVKGYPGRAILGAYLDLKGLTYKEAQALRRKQLGRDERIVHLFYGFGDNLPSTIKDMPKRAVPMISWRGTKYEKILDGSSDKTIRRAAQRMIQLDKPMFMRWGWEMNGSWFAWGGNGNGKNPAGYVETWKHIRQIFKDEGADKISWVWSVNWNNRPEEPWNTIDAYYPGDDHVDWVGISGYPLNNEKPETLYDGLYNAYAARKPMMITEVGSVDRGGYTKGDWVTKFYKYVEARPNICAVAWFDTDTHESYHELWKIDTDAHSLAAYKEMATSVRFSG